MKISSKILLTPKNLAPSFKGLHIDGIFNPGAIRLPDKRIMLMARVAESCAGSSGKWVKCPIICGSGGYKVKAEKIAADQVIKRKANGIYLKGGLCRLKTLSHFKKIILSRDGMEVESIGAKPAFAGTASEGQFGVEDPRIARLKGAYAMSYVAVSLREGISTCLAVSKDLSKWQRKGIIFREQNKDVVFFPEKINGLFAALHRPEGNFRLSKPAVWISYSPDLIFWGKEKTILYPRDGGWESERIGAGTVPIRTKEGWLELYHGVKKTRNKRVYCAGAVLLGLKNPEKVVARSHNDAPLLYPSEEYEKKGFVENVVFPSGAVTDLNGKDLLIYCGGADRVISVKKVSLKEVLNSMHFV